MPTLLAIDDDRSILEYFRATFARSGLDLDVADTGTEGLARFNSHRPDVVLLDLDLPDLTGLEVYRRMHAVDARVPTIFLTGSGDTDSAIEAMRLGAFEYLLKPLSFQSLREVVARAAEVSRLMRVPTRVSETETRDEHSDLLLGRCPAMQEVYKAIGRVAPQDVTVLIQGESGTGKELVARAIYQYSKRSTRPFLAINCAAIPEALLESELFGHEKGAFTSAHQRRIGKFEQCSGGTLFLDEIGDMTPLTQTKILRVLQQQEFERVGGSETIRTDVRLIAATNRELDKAVAASLFRADLYYRLNVYTIALPPLRERGGDLPLLIRQFVRHFSRQLGKEVREVAPDTLELLQRYPWPGNVRELQSVLKNALLHATGPVLLRDFLPPLLRGAASASAPEDRKDLNWEHFVDERLQAGTENLYAEWQAQMDRRLLARVMAHTGGNQSEAARILGIHRATLRTKLEAFGRVEEDRPDAK